MNTPIFKCRLVAGIIYEKIFHEKMSSEVVNFLKIVSYVGFGTFIATAFSFTFNVLSGRILGPIGYGKFSLVQSIAMFLYIPMIMGYSNAMIKYSAEKDSFDRQREIVSTTYILVLICTIVSVVIYLLVPQNILEYFSVSSEVFHLSIVFAVLFVVYTLTTSTLKALHKMKQYAMLTPIYSIVLLLVFITFSFFRNISYLLSTVSIIFAYMTTSILSLIYILKYLTCRPNKYWAYKLTNYGLYTIIGGIAFVFYTNIDQILINRYMSAEDLGIYKAYYYSSINVASICFNSFNSVFFPVASKYKDKAIILKRINKIIPYLIGIGTPFIVFSEFVILNLYGGAYKINFPLIILFAIVSILIVYYGLYDWTFCSEGIKGVKLVNKSTILIAIINITLDFYFIPFMGLFGAIISTGIAFTVGIYFLLKRGKYL